MVIKRSDFHGHIGHAPNRHELGARVVEPLLVQRRGAETGAERASQRESRAEIVAAGKLAVDGAAEVAVILESQGKAEQEVVGQHGFDFAIDTNRVTTLVDLVGWPEAGKYLDAGCSCAAELVAKRITGQIWGPLQRTRRRHGRGIVVIVGAIGPRRELAGIDLVMIVAVLETKGNVHCVVPAPVHGPDQVPVGGDLSEGQLAGISHSRAGPTECHIVRILDDELEGVFAKSQARIRLPLPHHRPKAGRPRNVVDIGRNQRQEAVGVDREHRTGIFGSAIESARFTFALCVTAEEIELRVTIAPRDGRVETEVQVL